jgi:tRNA 2-thiouridine synthesizing protein E
MSAVQIAGREVFLNHQGHLTSFTDWDNDVAEAIAFTEGLSLTDCHWNVINFLREYYAFHRFAPSPKVIINAIGDVVSRHLPCSYRDLDVLFPDGGCRQACRIAGLPDYFEAC